MVRSPYLLASLALALALSGCVKDPAVRNEATPTQGISQPRADGGPTLNESDACQSLLDAETTTRGALGCSSSATAPTCPDYLHVAGSLPCAEYLKSTVDACVSTIKAFAACSDFDAHPCVVTAVRSSCVAASVPEAGVDGAVAPPSDGGGGDSGDDQPDVSVPPADGSAGDAAITEAGPGPVDSGQRD